jgi:RNA polymerase sigma factor for flagellar operon FliA
MAMDGAQRISDQTMNESLQASSAPGVSTWPVRPAIREELILEHLPQVRLIARKIHDRLPDSVSLDDLVSTGIVGLIAAIDRFDEKHDVKLKTYAEYKIRGAILDSLRTLDWAPRLQRRRLKMIESAVDALERQFQRTPSGEEIATELKISMHEYQDWLSESRAVNLGSLDYSKTDEDNYDVLRFLADSDERWPSALFLRAELEGVLSEAIDKMPQIERMILTLYYYEEMTLREIAKILQLHESRISQLKSQAILRLRCYMQRR